MKQDLSKLSASLNCTGVTTKHDIVDVRGMSDPFFFSFNIIQHSNIMVCHGICFTSLVMHPEAKIELLTEDRDPRVEHLLKFIWSNFLKEKKNELLSQLNILSTDIETQKLELKELEQFIQRTKKENT